MAQIYKTGINSQGVLFPTSGISVTGPYISSKSLMAGDYNKIPLPVITIEASGDMTNLNLLDDTDSPNVEVYACAIPTGTVSFPTSTADLYTNYVSDGTDKVFHGYKHTSTISAIQSTPGETTSPLTYIYGNGEYDVYAAYVITRTNEAMNDLAVITYGELQCISGVRVHPSYPNDADNPDLTVTISDGGYIYNNNPIQLFSFDFNEPIFMTNLSQYGSSYSPSNLASSGYIQMTCSGVNTNLYYPPTIVTTAASTSPYYQYPDSILGGTIEWRVPKLIDSLNTDDYETYIFSVSYINTSGVIGSPLLIRYDGKQLKLLDNNNKVGASLVISDIDKWHGVPFTVNTNSRKRIAIGISDIDLQSIQYEKSGSYISNLFASDEPIYAVAIEASEQFNNLGDNKEWDYVKYYIQFGSTKSDEWIRISPKSRVGEIDNNGNPVSSFIVLDSLMVDEDKQAFPDNVNVNLVKYDKPIYNFRIKIDMDTSKSSEVGSWSPLIYDYKVNVLNRNIISSADVEKFLFI